MVVIRVAGVALAGAMLATGAALAPSIAFGQSALAACADQFIDGRVENAPIIGDSEATDPSGSSQHLCYRDEGVSFFALEYWPEHFAPRWAAYKLDPDSYGPDGCRTYTRTRANCYFKEANFQSCTNAGDPFHSDHMLTVSKLDPGDFSSTGHDRGHIAPRQAFSWHVCGTYQTFTMANMSPQRAFLNQNIWQFLERQVLTWAVDEGPIYVVTGATFGSFPHDRFEVYTDGIFDSSAIYPRGSTMQEVVEQHHINFASHPVGHILRPKRDATPSHVRSKVRELRMPTGYYKVIYRPATGSEPAHAISFLLPHTFENLNIIPDVDAEETFWAFVSRIDVIEESSGTRFPGIPESMKETWGDSFFLSRRTGRDIRSPSCGAGMPEGVVEDAAVAQRIAMCTDQLH
jgi:DNA/RNA non-specific endonuclease